MEGGYLSNAAVERSKTAPAAPAVHREGRSRDQPGAGHAGPRRRHLRHQGRPAGPVQRRHRLFGVAVDPAERQLRAQQLHGHRQPRGRGNQRRPVQQGVQPLAHRPVHDHRRRLAHGLGDLAQHLRSSRRRRRISRPRPARSALDYAWPLTEFQSVRMGFAAQRSDLFTDPNSSAAEALVLGAEQRQHVHGSADMSASRRSRSPTTAPSSIRSNYSLGWSYDSRNRALFADRGVTPPR